jgi:uncharacterized alkaline shock family protein YloU
VEAEAGPHISSDVVARYAADATLEVDGVEGLVKDRVRRHDGVRITGVDSASAVEIHVRVAAGASIPAVGREVQERVAAYLERMTGSAPTAVDVIVQEIG